MSRVSIERLALQAVEGRLGGLSYRIGELSLDGVQTDQPDSGGDGPLSIAAASGRDLVVDDGNLVVYIARFGMSEGLSLPGTGDIHVPRVSVVDARFEVSDIAAMFRGAGSHADAGAERRNGPDSWEFLDLIDGALNVDLFLDLNVPVLGTRRRRATHRFRVPLHGGSLDFERLEDDLHWLEDAFLHIELADDKLVLEKDIPLVPFAGKALMWWNLTAEEVQLARTDRVRLRSLLHWELPPPDPKPKKNRLELNEIALREIAVTLSTRGPAAIDFGARGAVTLGTAERPGVLGLQATGELHYNSHEPLEPTRVHGGIEALTGALRDLVLGSLLVDARDLQLGPFTNVELAFTGFRPGRLTGAVATASAHNLHLRPTTDPSPSGR